MVRKEIAVAQKMFDLLQGCEGTKPKLSSQFGPQANIRDQAAVDQCNLPERACIG